MTSSYLLPQDDGLPMRSSQEYAKDKLRILESYIYQFITSMRTQPWRALYFIDLQAGPGKNHFKQSQSIFLGSPLIALTSRYPFTQYRFVELGELEAAALRERVTVSERRASVKIYQGDCNIVVDEIVDEIRQVERTPIPDKWKSCLNLAFLDPLGLELQWETVKKLGTGLRTDLIINFSTSGFTRNARQLLQKEEATKIDSFFGTSEWKDVFRGVADRDKTIIRRTMIDFYKKRLSSLGYQIDFEHELKPDEQVMRNQKNAQIYTMIFASKHPLGNKFWQNVMERRSQPRLF